MKYASNGQKLDTARIRFRESGKRDNVAGASGLAFVQLKLIRMSATLFSL